MPYAAKPAAEPDAPWVQPDDRTTTIGPVACSQAWLAGLSEVEVAEQGLIRAEIAGAPPVPGLGNPPALTDVEGVPTWVWSPEGIESLRACRINQIKEEAGRRILALYPTWKQANMNMRAAELVDIRLDRELTPEETAERDTLIAAAAWIKDVRAASDSIEAALPNDAAALSAFNPSTADGWPEGVLA